MTSVNQHNTTRTASSLESAIQSLSSQLNSARIECTILRQGITSGHANSSHYGRKSWIDLEQNDDIEDIEYLLHDLALRIKAQQQRLLVILQSLRSIGTITTLVDPHPWRPKVLRCRGWRAVKAVKSSNSNYITFIVTGDVETFDGAANPILRVAPQQGRNPDLLILDLVESGMTLASNTATRFTTIRFEQRVRRGDYKQVQINRGGQSVALIDVVDDIIGPGPLSLPSGPDLQCGSKGERVRIVQQILSDIGYIITVDGDFSLETDKIVKDFQYNEWIKVDGIVGPVTTRHLNQVGRWWRPRRSTQNGLWRSVVN